MRSKKKGESDNGIVRNMLNRQQQRQLEDWVAAHWNEVERFRWTKDQVATQAAQRLGFLIVGTNVKTAAKTMGKEFPRAERSATNSRIPREALVAMIRAMSHFAGEWNYILPPIVAEFLKTEDEGHSDDGE